MFIRETHAAWDILRISGLLVVLGIPAYLFIEIFYDDKYVTLRRNIMAFFSHYTHHVALKHSIFRKIVGYVGPFKKNSTIVDFNCGTGSFVKLLIKDKVPFKQVYAVDKAKEEIKTFLAHIPQKFKKKIHAKYRPSWSMPKHIKKADVFVSFDALGHVSDIESFLKDVRKVLKKNGKFCFHIKHHVLNVTPNAVVLDDKKAIVKLFAKQKLKATYKREGAFTTHIFIYGRK
jgi:2-polyprenyl-3-methyl-5-hydroxy-6-metoxy-1,4-benzoquinol methylase